MSVSCIELAFPPLQASVSAGFQTSIRDRLTYRFRLARVDLGASVLAGLPTGVFRVLQIGRAEKLFLSPVKKVENHPFLLLKPYVCPVRQQPNRPRFFPGVAFLAHATLQNSCPYRSYLRSALRVFLNLCAVMARFTAKGMVLFHHNGENYHACNRFCFIRP